MLTEENRYKEVQLGPKVFNIPNKWEKKALGEIASIKNGYSFSSEDYSEDGVLLVRIGNVGNGVFQHKRDKFLPTEFLEEYSSYKLREGDVVIALTGDIGKYCFIPGKHAPALLNQRVGKVERDGQRSTEEFIYYSIGSKYFSDLIGSFFVGSAQNNISSRELESASIILPSLPEQKKIAKILSTVDKAIQKTEEIIERTKELKKGLMQDLLTKGIGHEEFKEVNIGPKRMIVPNSWKIVSLGSITETITKGTTPTSVGFDYQETGINFLKVENIKQNLVSTDGLDKISSECNEKLSRSKLQKGDILFSIAGSLGECITVREDYLPANINQAISIVRINEESVLNRFVEYYLKGNHIQSYIKAISTVSAQPNLSLKQVSNFRILIPPIEEQKEIVNILSNVDEKIQQEKTYKEELKNLKKGLMQDLLTGKVRVLPLLSEEEKEVLEKANVPG